jgi:hypothetical protein
MLHKAMFPRQHYHLSQGKERSSKNPRHSTPWEVRRVKETLDPKLGLLKGKSLT